MTRYAKVRGKDISERAIDAYMPRDYDVVAMREDDDGVFVLIAGEDDAGWTMEDFIVPRLASGLWWATECTEEEARCENCGKVNCRMASANDHERTATLYREDARP